MKTVSVLHIYLKVLISVYTEIQKAEKWKISLEIAKY